MIFQIPLQPLPYLTEIYTVKRCSVWRSLDERNILVYIKEGKCYFSIYNTEVLLEEGNFLFIKANEPYIRKPYNNTSCKMLYIHFHTPQSALLVSKQEASRKLIQANDEFNTNQLQNQYQCTFSNAYAFISHVNFLSQMKETVTPIIEKLESKPTKMPYMNYLSASIALVELLNFLSQTLLESSLYSDIYTNEDNIPFSLHQAITFIKNNYNHKITIEDLCNVSNISVPHLIRLFRKHLNTTPIQYINKCKVLRAIDLLRNTNISVKEIAFEVGFEDPNYFCHVFRKEENMSPSETRNRIQNYDKLKINSPAKVK